MEHLTTYMQSFVDSIDYPSIHRWMLNYPEIPTIVVTAYLVLVLYVPQYVMKDRRPYKLKFLNIFWNLLLTVFSFCGAYYTVPRLYDLVTAPAIRGIRPVSMRYTGNMTQAMKRNLLLPTAFREGVDVAGLRGSFDTSVCVWEEGMYLRGHVGFWSVCFMFSKIPEMVDTAFLVFQKKPLIFLHWFHHATVMLYCWHAYAMNTSSGLWFIGMNYAVHSIMYFYYFVCACGLRRLVRPFAPLITISQIAQMVVGTVIAVYSLVMLRTGKGCDNDEGNTKLALLMYFSYFILFSKLFKDSYLSDKAKKTTTCALEGGRPSVRTEENGANHANKKKKP